jgi:CheY-like chemotaxis protein
LALADQIRIEEKEARWRCAPIIGLSGSEKLDERGHGSMDVVLSKPFRVAELLALVTRYGKRVIHSGFE